MSRAGARVISHTTLLTLLQIRQAIVSLKGLALQCHNCFVIIEENSIVILFIFNILLESTMFISRKGS